jgi:transposase
MEAEASLDELANKTMGRTIEIIDSLPGIGRETAVRMAVLVGDFQRFSNCRKLVSFCGLSPTISQSGTSVHSKGTISRMGGHKIRSMLYVCTWSTLRHNEPSKAVWKRMKENGKPGKVIIMAMMNKMIRQMYSMVIHDTMYNPNFLAQAA